MKKLNLLLIGAALALPAVAKATIIGSPHDLSQRSWNTREKTVCSPCHAAHNTDPAKDRPPLWIHATTTATFVPYGTTRQGTAVGQPTGSSLACLSCHDGTVALNQMINGKQIGSPPEYIDPLAQIGPDLHTTHPVSFLYMVNTNNAGLNNPDTYKIGDPVPTAGTTPPVPASGWGAGTSLTGKTLNQALLGGNYTLQCSSCHDVHKNVGSSPTSGVLLKISGIDVSNRGSLICRNCHLK